MWLTGLLLWQVLIPEVCIEPMLRVYEGRSLSELEHPYRTLFQSGRLTLEGCILGFDPQADVMVPKDAVQHLADLIEQTRNPGQVEAWLATFLAEGCVAPLPDVRVCREGSS